MSTETRKYELKARAESQRETRERIARAASELHEEKGVAATTVAEIARRAGVTRPTFYNHFPELSDLFPACAAHYAMLHPPPDFEGALALEDHDERTRTLLLRLYGWYRETEQLLGNIFSDRASVPELDRFMEEDIDRLQADLAAGLCAGSGARGRRAQRLRAMAGLAVEFWTWRRLSEEGIDDEAAAGLMADAIASQAG